MTKIKKIFVQGPVSPDAIATSIEKHATKTNIGGHHIFLGQVRADDTSGSRVAAIEYTAHEALAEEKMSVLREEIFDKFDIVCMHIYHSLGVIKAGELCFFVFVSSKHRKAAMEACEFLVEKFKKEMPVWGKEILENEDYVWKINQS